MSYDGFSAANYADSHAELESKGRCALCVRRAIEWGGVSLMHTAQAKDMGCALLDAGFYKISSPPRKGDVIVIQPAPGHPDGHAAMYDGSQWVSDFKQMHGFYPGPSYRKSKPEYQIYRHD